MAAGRRTRCAAPLPGRPGGGVARHRSPALGSPRASARLARLLGMRDTVPTARHHEASRSSTCGSRTSRHDPVGPTWYPKLHAFGELRSPPAVAAALALGRLPASTRTSSAYCSGNHGPDGRRVATSPVGSPRRTAFWSSTRRGPKSGFATPSATSARSSRRCYCRRPFSLSCEGESRSCLPPTPTDERTSRAVRGQVGATTGRRPCARVG